MRDNIKTMNITFEEQLKNRLKLPTKYKKGIKLRYKLTKKDRKMLSELISQFGKKSWKTRKSKLLSKKDNINK